MITYKSGDILTEDVEAIVNTVNCVGVMGRGIALQFKNAYPDNFALYAEACKQGEVVPGAMFITETCQLTGPRYIVNFPTKRHWRGKSRIEDVETGLEALVHEIDSRGIKSIAIPPLGAGLGGLSWDQVRVRIEVAMARLPKVETIVFEPKGAPKADKMMKCQEVPSMTPGRAALVALMDKYLGGLLDPFVTLLETHKLMYFLQEAGEGLRLNFQKAHYGPYAQNLTHVFRAIEGHLVTGYADGGDDPTKQLKLVPGAIEDATKFLETHSETQSRLDKVCELVEGFETPFGLELLSTVHWMLKHESVNDVDELVTKIHAWNDRKKQFTAQQIRIAYSILTEKLWVPTVQ